MPGGDRTGPAGFGPMTGRRAGFCAGYAAPGFMNPAYGIGGGGWGRGFGGGGRRHRHWYYATGLPGWQRTFTDWPAYTPPFSGASVSPPTKEQELDALKNQAKYFEQALDDLRNRISEFESAAENPKSK
ncbi:MAG: DUF5320 domain-containing protein [Acidobacteria bacterium]|nr:DUF5320 domain-containing protein [Acidobacteriota bacterium]